MTSTEGGGDKSEEIVMIDQVGKCLCGAVEFHAEGQILFNELCHCRACTWAASVSPVHLIGAERLTFTKGKDKVVIIQGLGTMIHARCCDCMSLLYQRPKEESCFAVFPPTFHIGGDHATYQKLPNQYLPTMHANYENRQRDYEDSLPKYKSFPPHNQMNNDGSLLDSESNANKKQKTEL